MVIPHNSIQLVGKKCNIFDIIVSFLFTLLFKYLMTYLTFGIINYSSIILQMLHNLFDFACAVSVTADGHQKKSEKEFLELEQKGEETAFFSRTICYSFVLFFGYWHTSYSCQLIKCLFVRLLISLTNVSN